MLAVRHAFTTSMRSMMSATTRTVPISSSPFSRSAASLSSSRLHQPLGTVPDGVDLQAVREKWGSDAMEKIQQVPIIYVDGPVAVCDGGGGALGHPVEYIKLLVGDEDAGPQVCKYCGLRYQRKPQR